MLARSTACCAVSVAKTFAIAASFGTSGPPASAAVAAAVTSSRAASIWVATSASACETAWKSRNAFPNASRDRVCAIAASSAASAIPTAPAPTLGRNRLSVVIATRKPPSTEPSTSPSATRTPSSSSVPIGCGEISSSDRPLRPGESPATANAVTPRGPAAPVRANTV
jgi:hypothetical protein